MLLQTSLGLDIAATKATILGVQQTLRGARPIAQDVFPLDADRPLALQFEAVAAWSKGFIQRHKLAGAGLFLGFPSHLAVWRTISLPAAARESLAETIRYEFEKYLPLSPDEVCLDHQVVAEDRATSRIQVLLTVVKRADLQPFRDLASRLGNCIAGAEPGICALAHFSQFYPGWCPAEDAVLACQTTDGLQLLRLQRGLIRAAHSLPGQPPDPDRTRRALKALQTLPGRESAVVSCPVFFAGQGLSAEVIRDWLSDTPATAIAELDFGGTMATSSDWAATGLALRGLMRPKVGTNLLPREMCRRPSRMSLYVLWGLALLAFLSGVAWGGSSILARHLQQKRLEREFVRLAAEMGEIDRLQEAIHAAQAKIDFLVPAGGMRLPALDMLKVLTGILPESAWVRELNMDKDKIRIDGYADNASDLIARIDASPYFTEVAFLSAITRGRDGKEKFRIGFRLKENTDATAQ